MGCDHGIRAHAPAACVAAAECVRCCVRRAEPAQVCLARPARAPHIRRPWPARPRCLSTAPACPGHLVLKARILCAAAVNVIFTGASEDLLTAACRRCNASHAALSAHPRPSSCERLLAAGIRNMVACGQRQTRKHVLNGAAAAAARLCRTNGGGIRRGLRRIWRLSLTRPSPLVLK